MEKYQAVIANKTANYPEVNWTDFNFPPCCSIIHFTLSELHPPFLPIVRLIYITFLIIFIESIINIISAIAQAASGYPSIIILYAFLNFVLLNSAQFWVFYRGYQGICKDMGLLKIYKIAQFLLAILWLVLSIIGDGAFNGFTKIVMFQQSGEGGLLFLCILESILYIGNSILCTFCVYRVHFFSNKE